MEQQGQAYIQLHKVDINETEGTINLDFTVNTEETDKKLILKSNHVEGEIPELNGYAPTSVVYTGTTGANIVFNYNNETRTFTIDRTSIVGENGAITSSLSTTSSYGIKVTYPLEAYQTLGTERVQIKIPVRTYYEGYNNPNTEFTNPYKSNIATSTIVATYEKKVEAVYSSSFEIKVGRYVYSPSYRYIVSKQKPLKIYNGQSEEEKNDTYTVMWRAYVGTNAELGSIVIKETRDGQLQVADQFIKTDTTTERADDVVSNVGIYFSGADTVLGEEGEILVYDEDTDNVVARFAKNNWNKYTETNPYKYEIPVKHVRIETSNVVENEVSLYAYNVKEIEDESITTKYEREQFDELKYIKSTLVGNIGTIYTSTVEHQANYEAPMSIAGISISKSTIPTQTTERNVKITVSAQSSENNN